MNDLGPIFRTLMRNRLGALLIALQIALTLAIVTNAGFIIQQRAADIARERGLMIDEQGFAASRFVMGRSLGSLPAAELAATAHERLAGLVIESGAPDLDRLRRRAGIAGSNAEIAELAGMAVGSSKAQLHRARKLVREELER